MNIHEEIVKLITESTQVPVPINGSSNLYRDLYMDSLALTDLLIGIEERYAIVFDLFEIEACLQVGRLISLVEEKIKEADHDPKPVSESNRP